MTLSRQNITRRIYMFLLSVLLVAMSTSNYFMNMMWVFLLANWIVEGDWHYKWGELRHNYLLHAVLVLFGLHLLGLLWSDNLAYGLDDIRKKLPLLAVPLVVLTSRPFSQDQLKHLKGIFIATVVVVSTIGVVRYLTIPDLPYRDLNPYISHIRFSLDICIALTIIVADIRNAKIPKLSPTASKVLMGAAGLFLTGFLMLQQSYTAFVTLGVVVVVTVFAARRRGLSRLTGALLALALGASAFYIHDYYSLRSLSTQELAVTTANGTPYTHKQDGFVERGGYVHNYLCDEELYREWPKHSGVALDSVTEVGYPLYGALVRYLNCLDLPKDSSGICQLTAADIAAIEKGVANPSYLRQGSPAKFFDQLLFEFETARHQSSIRGFTMLERLELWQNGWNCIKDHPLIGVGTGDVVDVEHARLAAIDSPIADTTKHIHNQYLTLILSFGFVGFALILFFVVRALRQGPKLPLLNAAFVVIVLVSFINEDTLETLAGIMLVVVWGSIFNRQRNHVPIPHSK